MIRKIDLIIVLFLILTFIGSFLYIADKNLFVDEEVHYLQIKRFMSGDRGVYDIITVIPGYHYFLSVIGKTFDFYSEGQIRLVNATIGFISIFVFLLLTFKIEGKRGWRKGLEYAFFPILFPFFFLIYTDVLSLLLVMAMVYFTLIKRYSIAAIFGILSFFVRQNNVVWMGFALFLVYFQRNGMKIKFSGIGETIKNCWVFILGLAISVLFFIYNGGFSAGDKAMHEGGIFLGNIFFFLFLFFFLFFFLNISNIFRIKEFTRKNKWIWILLIGIFIIYMKFFVVDHPYNFLGKDYFLRNIILQEFISGIWIKACLFIPIAYSILSLCVIKLKKKEFYLIYLFSFISLLPMWLIEQRYYLIPFTLFILFKEESKNWVERATIGIYFIASIVIFYLIGEVKFFL
ncbi:MAG: hypothetical protein Q7S27_04745 [Nanoarchaeota archaeon]|nr:hypothetical protein [Nanoarchaeota archaeon]